MFKDPQIILFYGIIISFISHILTGKTKQYFLLLMSGLLIFAISYKAFFIALLTSIITFSSVQLSKKVKFKYSTLIYILMIVSPLLALRIIDVKYYFLVSLGLSFFSLKSVAIFINSLRGKSISFFEILSVNFFFPTFSSGPVIYPENLRKLYPFDKHYFYSVIRVVIGLFKANFISGTIIKGILQNNYSGFLNLENDFAYYEGFIFIGLKFLYTYVNFSGYSDIAIGFSRMCGIKVSENFKLPLLATSIQDFWRRWHISLGDWVTNYMFFPIVTNLKSFKSYAAPVATIISFMILGLWHSTSANYLIWGIGHGVCLAVNQKFKMYKMKNKEVKKYTNNRASTALFWFITIFIASFLQTFANLKSFDEGINLILRLI